MKECEIFFTFEVWEKMMGAMKAVTFGIRRWSVMWMLGGMLVASLAAEELQPGMKAPPFELQGSDGKTYALSSFLRKTPVVLAWFPKAFTTGCTRECQSLQEHHDALQQFDVAYFAVSCDTPEVNRKFAESLNAEFPILSNPDKSVARRYGVVTPERRLPYRWTFYIGKDGTILAIDKKVNTARHGADVAEKLEALQIPKR